MKKLVCALISVLLLFSVPAIAAWEYTLEWDANTEPDLAGYRLFSREFSGTYNYTNPIWEGTDTTAVVVVDDEHAAFVVRAFDVSGDESADSNEDNTWMGPPAKVGGCSIKNKRLVP